MNLDRLYSKNSKLGLGTIKVLYQYSKDSKNDSKFTEMLDVFFNVLNSTIMLDLDDSHYDLLIFLFGILKNISTAQHSQE